MDKKLLERAKKCEAEARAIRRAEKQFRADVIERADEVKKWLDLSDRFDEICAAYDAYTDAEKDFLYTHLISDEQVDYYRRMIQPEGSYPSSF